MVFRFKVLMAVMILIIFFWVKLLCGLVSRSQHFGEACCLHLQGWRWRHWLLPTSPHSDVTQKSILVWKLLYFNRLNELTSVLWAHKCYFLSLNCAWNRCVGLRLKLGNTVLILQDWRDTNALYCQHSFWTVLISQILIRSNKKGS
jgi:hypothetical protein